MKHASTNRIILYTLILFITVGGVFFSNRYYKDYLEKKENFISSISSKNMHLSNNASLVISELMLPQMELVGIAVKKLENMDLYDDEHIESFLYDRSAGFTTVGGFFLGRNDGTHFTNSGSELPPGYDPRERIWYKQAVSQNKLIITDSYIDALTGQVCVTIAAPVYQNGILM